MKIAMIGQDIPTLLPTLLTDLWFVSGAEAQVCIEEKNPAMQDVLQGYCEAIHKKSGLGGSILVSGDRYEVLENADCLLYAGDCMAASRFHQDRSALSGESEDDPGLSDQARVNGGIGGLMHTLRAGETVLELCEAMDEVCPEALVINLGQPVARTTAIFLDAGYRCFGLGRTPYRGANGLDTMAKRLRMKPDAVSPVIAGLPGFAFLIALTETATGRDLLPQLKKAARNNELGQLSRRWLDWWDALPVGDVTDHAEFLPAQPDFIPDENPEFGESVEKRKDRILYMNTVREQGANAREGAMAQLLLLSKAPPIRPMRLATALLNKESTVLPAVTFRNRGRLPRLKPEAVVEADLVLRDGQPLAQPIILPEALVEILTEIDETNRLAARAATGDRGALRTCIDTDPALAGLDRIYCQDLVEKLIELHGDILERL